MQYTTVYEKGINKSISLNLAKLIMFVFTVGTIISIILYPGYSMTDRYLSELGTNGRSAVWFNLSIMLSSLLLFPLFIGLFYFLRPKVSGWVEFVLILGFSSSILTSTFMFMMGLFPAKGSTLYIHNLAAIMFFMLLGVTFWLFTLVLLSMQSDIQFTDRKVEDYFGLLFLPLVVLFADLSLWYSKLLQKTIVYLGLFYLTYLVQRLVQFNQEREVYYHKEKFEQREVHSIDETFVLSNINF